MMDIWPRIAFLLEKELNPGTFQLWIKPLEASLKNDTLIVRAPNEFVKTRVERRLLSVITKAANRVLGYTPRIEIIPEPSTQILTADSDLKIDIQPETQNIPSPGPQLVSRQMTLPVTQTLPTQRVHTWRHCFDDFIVGPCNNLAHAASKSFCQDLHGAEQLFLCSASGLGKTHLAQAIGREIARQTNRQHLRVCYLSAEEFASQLVMAIKSKTVEQFKTRFRSNIDLLLLEDVHFFQGKEKMQDELLNTLDALRNQGRKVVMTSTFLPRQLSDIDSNLVSRFTQGFLTVIDKPDHSTRLNIIAAKAQADQTFVPEDVADLLADRIKSDIRQLESCLKNIILRSKLLDCNISMDLAWEVLQNYNLDEASIDMEKIISFVCQAYGFNLDELRSKSRKKDRVIARNTAFFLARQHTELSLADIGRHFNRKHSTVIKGVTSVEREIARQTTLGNQISRTIRHLQS